MPSASLSPVFSFTAPPGSGPRHLEFHPSGKFCYVAHEISCAVEALSYDQATGELRSIGLLTALPEGWPGGVSFPAAEGCPLGTSTSEAHVSKDGRFVYVGVRVVAAEGLITVFVRLPLLTFLRMLKMRRIARLGLTLTCPQ